MFPIYVGYCGWLLPFHSSVPSLISFPHFCQTDRDRSDPDQDSSSSKRNNSSSTKHGEAELEQIQKELGGPDLLSLPSFTYSSPVSLHHHCYQKPSSITKILLIFWAYINSIFTSFLKINFCQVNKHHVLIRDYLLIKVCFKST